MADNKKWINENTARIEALAKRLEEASYTDVSDTTATSGDVATGKVFYNKDGVKTEGSGELLVKLNGWKEVDVPSEIPASGYSTFASSDGDVFVRYSSYTYYLSKDSDEFVRVDGFFGSFYEPFKNVIITSWANNSTKGLFVFNKETKSFDKITSDIYNFYGSYVIDENRVLILGGDGWFYLFNNNDMSIEQIYKPYSVSSSGTFKNIDIGDNLVILYGSRLQAYSTYILNTNSMEFTRIDYGSQSAPLKIIKNELNGDIFCVSSRYIKKLNNETLSWDTVYDYGSNPSYKETYFNGVVLNGNFYMVTPFSKYGIVIKWNSDIQNFEPVGNSPTVNSGGINTLVYKNKFFISIGGVSSSYGVAYLDEELNTFINCTLPTTYGDRNYLYEFDGRLFVFGLNCGIYNESTNSFDKITNMVSGPEPSTTSTRSKIIDGEWYIIASRTGRIPSVYKYNKETVSFDDLLPDSLMTGDDESYSCFLDANGETYFVSSYIKPMYRYLNNSFIEDGYGSRYGDFNVFIYGSSTSYMNLIYDKYRRINLLDGLYPVNTTNLKMQNNFSFIFSKDSKKLLYIGGTK
jgi:hypothetical protein